jgi:hypothetical protein
MQKNDDWQEPSVYRYVRTHFAISVASLPHLLLERATPCAGYSHSRCYTLPMSVHLPTAYPHISTAVSPVEYLFYLECLP